MCEYETTGETTTGLDECLTAAAATLGMREAWEDADGPDSGCGVDFWFVHADRASLFLHVNQDQDTYTWATHDEATA